MSKLKFRITLVTSFLLTLFLKCTEPIHQQQTAGNNALPEYTLFVQPEKKYVANTDTFKIEVRLQDTSGIKKAYCIFRGRQYNLLQDSVTMLRFQARRENGKKVNDNHFKKSWKAKIRFVDHASDTNTRVVKGDYYVIRPVIKVSSPSILYLYEDCSNKLHVGAPALGASYSPSFKVNSPSGEVKVKEYENYNGEGYISVCPAENESITIDVYSGGIHLGSETFNVKDIPKPKVHVYKKYKKVDCKEVFAKELKDLKVKVEAQDDFKMLLPTDARYRIFSCDVALLRKGEKIVEASCGQGRRLSLSNKIIRKARPGDKLNIKVDEIKRMNAYDETFVVDMEPVSIMLGVK